MPVNGYENTRVEVPGKCRPVRWPVTFAGGDQLCSAPRRFLSDWFVLPIAIQGLRSAFQSCGKYCKLLPHSLTVTFVQSLVHFWNDDRGISGIFSRRINGMPIPGTARQALRHKQCPFSRQQGLVQARNITGWILLL